MKRRFIICAMTLSKPGTMGGNSKITLEMAKHLGPWCEVHFVVPADKAETFRRNVPVSAGVHVHEVGVYPKSEFRHPLASSRFYYRELRRVLTDLAAGPGDVLYCNGDFHVDSVPAFLLQRRFGFAWLPSAFLFVPGPLENLLRGYGFPVAAYFLAWLYARFYVFFSCFRSAGWVITNTDDFRHFPKRFRDRRIFPFYGGVNVDQIPAGPVPKTRDVVFCSRLCAQKGIRSFLDVWKLVHDRLPSARFTVIGNGAPDFERALRAKAARLGIDGSVDWLGYVNNEAKYEIYRSARVMVHPTIFDNNGMVAAEALCSGLPVVMYDLPPLRHVYTTGCAKVPFGDKAAFADEVVRLLSDDAHRASVAPDAAQVAELRSFWDWPNRVARFRDWLGTVGGRAP